MGITTGNRLAYRIVRIGNWDVPIIEFTYQTLSATLWMRGTIINGITENTAGQKDWKRRVTSGVKAVRGGGPWDPNLQYAVSLGMTFHRSNHGYRSDLDVDNFIKPVLDAMAAGLFCSDDTDPFTIERWNFDDSNFRTLLIHRLPDAPNFSSEGVGIHVSAY